MASSRAASYLVSYIISRLAPWVFSNDIAYNIVSLIPLYAVGVPIFALILTRLPSISPLPEKMGGRWWGGLCCSFTMMALGNYVSQILIMWFEAMSGITQTNPVAEATSGSAWWINLIFIGILAPVLEELIFRRMLCRRLLPLGEGYAILFSALIFGLCHGNFFQFFYAFATGLIFGLVYVKTGRTIYSMLYHVIINILGGVIAPLIIARLDIDALNAALESVAASGYSDMSALTPFMNILAVLGLYEISVYGAAIVGTVLLIKARKKYSLDTGLLAPPREGRVANVFMNAGVATALAGFAFIFITSLL